MKSGFSQRHIAFAPIYPALLETICFHFYDVIWHWFFSFNYIFLISKISYSLNFLVFMTSHHSLKIPVFCSSRILALFAPLSTCVAVHLVRIILSHRPCVCHCQISLMNLRASHSVTHWASLFRLRIFFSKKYKKGPTFFPLMASPSFLPNCSISLQTNEAPNHCLPNLVPHC